jgi:hypothetical protein
VKINFIVQKIILRKNDIKELKIFALFENNLI